jgi:hypothetical protein
MYKANTLSTISVTTETKLQFWATEDRTLSHYDDDYDADS